MFNYNEQKHFKWDNDDNVNKKVEDKLKDENIYDYDKVDKLIDEYEKKLNNMNGYKFEQKITDEMVIYIPTKSDDGNQSIIDNKEKKENKIDSKVSINTANISSLMTLSGIGKKKAEAKCQKWC